ncbi:MULTISPECIES: cysteine peptidase family C39 domain-containing protein [environmental samples]
MIQDVKCVNQKDAMDCGPACLAMVVKHYGRSPYPAIF